MKRIGLFLLVAVVVAGVAGCRHSSAGPECPTYYCGQVCGNAIECGIFPKSDVDGCMAICTAMSVGKDDVECQDLYAPATKLSCDELRTFLLGTPTALNLSNKLGCFTF
jgi:hypothetical protein